MGWSVSLGGGEEDDSAFVALLRKRIRGVIYIEMGNEGKGEVE